MDPAAAIAFRSSVINAQFLAQDQPDLIESITLMSRHMAAPRAGHAIYY